MKRTLLIIIILQSIVYGQNISYIPLLGHRDVVNSVQFSPDGKKIVSAASDSTAKIWNAESGKLLGTLKGDSGIIQFAQFSPDGKKIITISDNGIAIIWDTESGKLLSKFYIGSKRNIIKQFSPNWEKVLIINDRIAEIWSTENRQLQMKLNGHKNTINSAQFSPDGNKIVTSYDDGTLQVWDAETGKPLTKITRNKKRVFLVRFNINGDKIISVSEDTVYIWETSGRLLENISRCKCHSNDVLFSSNGERMLINENLILKIWETRSGKFVSSLNIHDENSSYILFSSNGERLATYGSKGLKIWNVNNGNILANYSDGIDLTHIDNAIFNVNGNKIAIISSSGSSVRIWDINSKKSPIVIRDSIWIRYLEFSPDGKSIVTASLDNIVRIWNIDNIIQGKEPINSPESNNGANKTDTLGSFSKIKFDTIGQENNKIPYTSSITFYKSLAYEQATKGNIEKVWACEYFAGLGYYNLGNLDEALSHFKRAVKTIELYKPMDIKELLCYGQKEDALQDVYKKVISISINNKQADSALLCLEKYNQFGMRKLRGLPLDSSDTRGTKLCAIASSLDSMNVLAMYDTSVLNKVYAENRKVIENNYLVYIDNIIRENPELTNSIKNSINPTDLFAQTGNIPKSTIVVEYLYDENDLYIFVISRDTLIVKDVNVSDTTIDNYTDQFLERLKGTTNFAAWMTNSTELYNILIKPIIPLIKNYDILEIIPTDKLVNLPFGALFGRFNRGSGPENLTEPNYLLQNLQIYYPYMLKYFILPGRTKEAYLPVAFGNPDGSLPGAEIEVKNIGTIIPSSVLYVRDEATKTRVKAITGKNNILHLATHGILDYYSYNRSYFILGKDSINKDGRLTLDDVRRISELRKYDMVVLSACNSAVSENKVKGWINNPARVFLDVGVESVIASLWPVDDASTCLLMKNFYTNLAKYDKSEALRRAQLNLLNNPKYSNPYYWAPFILLGRGE